MTVDRATDTVLVRAVMPNPDDVLRDGQLVAGRGRDAARRRKRSSSRKRR